jgi:hypothetical protein
LCSFLVFASLMSVSDLRLNPLSRCYLPINDIRSFSNIYKTELLAAVGGIAYRASKRLPILHGCFVFKDSYDQIALEAKPRIEEVGS